MPFVNSSRGVQTLLSGRYEMKPFNLNIPEISKNHMRKYKIIMWVGLKSKSQLFTHLRKCRLTS